MNRANFAREHQTEIDRNPLQQILPHLSDDITNDTRMPYSCDLRVMPDVAHNYGGGRDDSRETRNFSVGVKLRDAPTPLEKLRGEDPCWEGYEMIGMKKKKGKSVPNCVPKGEGKPFTNKELTKIILDKNEVIADLERNAYGKGFWDDVRAGLVKHNERKKSTPISEEDWKKQMEDYEKPTTDWGMDELDGGGVVISRPGSVAPPAGSRVAVGADGTVIHTRGTLPPPAAVQRRIVETALGHANNVALARSGWQSPMTDGATNKFVVTFRQSPSISQTPELLAAVRRNDALIKELAGMRPELRDSFIEEISDDISVSLNNEIRASGRELDDVYKEIKRSYGGGTTGSIEPPRIPPAVGLDGNIAFEPHQKKIISDAVIQADESGAYYCMVFDGRSRVVTPELLVREYRTAFMNSLQRTATILSPLYQFFRTPNGDVMLNYMAANRDSPATNRAYISSKLDEICRGVNIIIGTGGRNVNFQLGSIKRNTEADKRHLLAQAAQDYPTADLTGISLGEGGAEPAATPSPVAAAAAALKPVREELQKGIGSLIYGEEEDPRKQKKGLLGISEEGKEESKKKVEENIVKPIMKNIVVPLATGAIDLKDRIFNPEEYQKRFDAETKRRKIATEQSEGIFRNKEGIIMKKPRGLYNGEELMATEKEEKESYVRIPNPLYKVASPSSRDLELAGIKLWEPVDDYKNGNMGKTLKEIQTDEFIFVPEKDVKSIYSELSKYASGVKDQELATGFEELGWNKGDMKAFAKLGADFASFTPQEKQEYLQVKAVQEKQQLNNALAKVEKDIKDEEAKASPDQARLAKMRDAKVKVIKRQEDKVKESQEAFKTNYGSGRITDFLKGLFSRKSKPSYEPGQTFRPVKSSPYAGMYGLGKESSSSESDSDLEGSGKKIDFSKIKWGSFTEQAQRAGYSKDKLDAFADKVLANPDDFSAKTEKRANFYKNVLKKGRGEFSDRSSSGSDSDNSSDSEDLEGGGAIEFSLQKAGKMLFNPTGDTSHAGRQTFTPDWDAYGSDAANGRKNAFELSRSMYNQGQALDIAGFKLVKDDTSLRFYLKEDEPVIMVGIRGTDVKSYTDLYTWAVIGAKQDFRMTTRFQDDLQKLIQFQKNYSRNHYYYVATGSSLAGSIADRFLDMGLIEEAVTYNPSIEKKYLLDDAIHNHRIYLDTDPLFMLMGQYAPNTEIRVNANKANYYNPSKEGDYLVASHSIYPVYNPAFEGGGLSGGGKTYTIEDWKRIFDAKLEEKRQKIEARTAKKKDTAKAKRDRAKARRDEMAEIPELEMPFRTSRVMKATPPKEPKKPRKPRLKVVAAPASARVELREELVSEQPRNPAGEFAMEAVVQPRPMTALPRMTMKQKEFFMNLLSRNVSATQKSILLARSGMSDKLVERLLPFMTSSNKRAVMKQTGMITEKVAEKRTDTDYKHLPADIKKGLRKLAQDIMNMKGRRPTMLDDARRTDTLKKMTETEKRQMLRRNFVAGVKSCEAIASMTRTDMFGDYSCRKWDATEPSFFKRVETSEYGVKKKCMAIGDEANLPQGATLDQLKPVVGVGRDNAVLSSRMLAELSPSTWGVEDKPEPKNVRFGVPLTKSTPDADLAEHIRQTQRVWRLCILEMLDSCGIKATIQKELSGTWKRGYGIIINWATLQKDDKNLTKVKVREAQEEVNEKLSSPKLRDFLLDLRGFCAMVADETEAEDEGDVAQRRKDEEERIYMRRLESEITPDEEEERAKVLANPELKAKLWEAVRKDQRQLERAFDTTPFSGDLRQRINRMKRIAGIDYNIGYGSVVPANFWVSGLKAKLPPIRKKEGYYPSVEQYIRDMEKK